jgi:Family of unknown function (DUF5719)
MLSEISGERGGNMRRITLALAIFVLVTGMSFMQLSATSTAGESARAQADGIAAVNGATSPVWYMAEGSTAWGFFTYVTIENPNNVRLHAHITYMTPDGELDGGTVGLAPESQLTLNPAQSLYQTDFSTKVECLEGQDIAVDRTMTWSNYEEPWYGPEPMPYVMPFWYGYFYEEGHSSIGVTSPATTWYMPEGCSGYGFETWLLIQNPNPGKATCTVTYMTETAGPVTRVKEIAGNTRASFNMKDDIGAQSASIEVESDIPVIPERSMYKDNKRGGSDSIGATTPSTDCYLAEGSTGYGFTTYLLVQNPNAASADVTVYCQTPAGEVVLEPFTVPGNSRKTLDVNGVLPDTDVSFRVHGSQPIVAERSMYWDNGTGVAMHDSIGMSAPHTRFYLPDGDSGQRETWTLVENPNNTPVKIEIAYFTDSGQGDVWFTDTLRAHSRKSYNMMDWIQYSKAATMVTSLTAGRKIVVERSMYWNGRGAGSNTIGAFSD